MVAVYLLLMQGICVGANASFTHWLTNFFPEVQRQGISRQTYATAFKGITEPDGTILEKAAYQPEFTLKIWEYLDSRVNERTIRNGRLMKIRYGQTLAGIEHRFGVSPSVLLAIWSMETNYGVALTHRQRLYYVPLALATLAWGDAKRSSFAKTQLVAALRILQSGDVTRDQLLGSWAGAMGHTQFIPTSYLAYAVDMDGNGRRDIWHSVPDALATAANLLAKNRWQSGRTWGYEVVVPRGSARYEGSEKTLADWQRLGIVRPLGRKYPRPGDKAILKLFAGEQGPGFLVMKNFFVLKRYNSSDFYALAVGLLADRLSGWPGLAQKWPRPPGSLSADEKFELQRLLKEKGYYTGEIDGDLGGDTRGAIREFQKAKGALVDGKPTSNLLQALRR